MLILLLPICGFIGHDVNYSLTLNITRINFDSSETEQKHTN